MQALYIAATGMAAQETNVNVISNNIANMRTTGYKRQRAEFQDLLYQEYQRAGSTTSDSADTQLPVGLEVGSGVKLVGTPRIMSQGTPVAAQGDFNLAIQGEGFLMVNLPDGRTAYTRDGSLQRSGTGQIVTADGYEVQPGITVPDNASSITVAPDGTVSALIGTDTTPTQLGQLQLARFVNKAGLESLGQNLFVETPASGPGQVGVANADGMGSIMQNYLEDSNVDSVTEISDLIAAQRAYEMNASVVTGADEMLQTTTQMK
jgi:flagellar basal-body rod protein FlgG